MSSLSLKQLIIWYRDIGQHIAEYDDDKSMSKYKKEVLINDLNTLLGYTLSGHKNDESINNFYKTKYIVENFTWIQERQMWIYTSNYIKNKDLCHDKSISNETIHEKMMEDVEYDLDGNYKGGCNIM